MEKTRKESTPNFPKNEHFLQPDTHTYVYVFGDKKCLFFVKFDVLCFLVTSVLRSTLLPYYRRYTPTLHLEIHFKKQMNAWAYVALSSKTMYESIANQFQEKK